MSRAPRFTDASRYARPYVRDDNPIAAFSADFRKPDRLQQAWIGSDGGVQWRNVEVIKESEHVKSN